MSEECLHRGITLIVIGVGCLVEIYDRFLWCRFKGDRCAHVFLRGGEYIPIVNTRRILLQLLDSLLNHDYTLLQSLGHIKQEEFEQNSSYHSSSMATRNV